MLFTNAINNASQKDSEQHHSKVEKHLQEEYLVKHILTEANGQ